MKYRLKDDVSFSELNKSSINKEYTYNIDKYTIGVDENGKDEIGLTIAIIKNGESNFLGNYYGENARCIDLLIKENQKLKKQLEDKEDHINKLQATKDKLDKWDYENTMQQKEFINYLQEELNVEIQRESIGCEITNKRYILEKILQKYKSIIGENDV